MHSYFSKKISFPELCYNIIIISQYLDRQTDRQTDKRTDEWTDRQTDRQTGIYSVVITSHEDSGITVQYWYQLTGHTWFSSLTSTTPLWMKHMLCPMSPLFMITWLGRYNMCLTIEDNIRRHPLGISWKNSDCRRLCMEFSVNASQEYRLGTCVHLLMCTGCVVPSVAWTGRFPAIAQLGRLEGAPQTVPHLPSPCCVPTWSSRPRTHTHTHTHTH